MNVKPFYQDEWVQIYHGDCRLILPELPKVDLVLTDPPYGVDYAEWDIEMPYDILLLLLERYNCPIAWFGSSPNLPKDLTEFPISPDRIIIWSPRFTLSHTINDGIAYRWQPIYLWRIPKEHNIKWDIIGIPTECGNWWEHKATKPVDLISLLCTLAPAGGLILDPFLGSGTTAYCAKKLNRHCIGIEIEEKYCEIAANRCRQMVMELKI